MKKNLLTITMGCALLLLMGAGCASTSSPTTTAVEDKEKSASVPLAEIEDTIWYTIKNPTIESQKDGYTTFTFSNGSGTCVEKGITEFSLYYDEAKKYAQASVNKERGLSLGMYFTSESRISGITTSEGKVTCTALPKQGQNDVPLTCKLEASDTEYCTGTYQGVAQK